LRFITIKENMLRRTALLGLSALISACSSTSTVPDGTEVGSNEGVLVIQLSGTESGLLEFSPHAIGQTSYGTALTDRLAGRTAQLRFGREAAFFVLPIEAGEYMWTRLSLVNRYALLSSSTRFKISKATITYIGALRISVADGKYSARVFDRETDARTHLAEKYPKYLASLPFHKELADLRMGA
jgi:hypothetical protein